MFSHLRNCAPASDPIAPVPLPKPDPLAHRPKTGAAFRMTKKRLCYIFTALALVGLACHASAETAARSVLVNGGFERGLEAWKVSGDVRQVKQPLDGRRPVRIGPGPGSISQRVAIDGNNHLQISAIFDSVPRESFHITLRFLDKNGRQLMAVDSNSDLKPGKDPRKIDWYLKPHPLTASVEITVAKTGHTGSVTVDQVDLGVYEEDDPSLQSTESFADAMRPLWQGDTVSREAVLMLSEHGMPATGTLMFKPTRILAVTDYSGATTYQQGVDFTSAGRTLICTPASRMTQVSDASLLKGELAWNIIGGKQIMVTYQHSDAWTGPTQPYVGGQMPKTIHKLMTHAPLRVVAYGDSITFGLGSSRLRKLAPYQAPWIELFQRQLQRAYGDPDIALYNSSQSGADSNWARTMAARMVASLNPDLVVIAFGQNDFWSVSPETFAANISSIIHTVRSANPAAEFLLVSTMRFDPAYSTHQAYWNTVTAYDAKLHALTGPGVQLVDLTAISGAVFAAKEPKDCLNDPLHPNDYLSRWYAQSLVAALSNTPASEVTAAPVPSH